MAARTTILAIFLLTLALIVPSHAAGLKVSVIPSEQTAVPGSVAAYDLHMVNELDAPDNVTVTVSGQNLHWFQDGIYLLVPLEPKSTFTAPLKLYPVGDLYGEFPYTITITSLLDGSRSASIPFLLNVGYGDANMLVSVKADVRGSDLLLTFKAFAPTKAVLPITIRLTTNNGADAGVFQIQEEIEGIRTFEKTIRLTILPVGEYLVEASIDGGETLTAPFTILPVRQVVAEETVVQGNWYDEVIVTVTNKGNVPEENYVLNYPVPADKLTGFVTQSEGCIAEAGKKTCAFALPPLGPGEIAQVVYRIEYWPSAAGFAAGGVVLAMLAGFGYISLSRPRIIKSRARQKGGVSHIVLEVKSPRVRDAKAVVVRDFVTPMAEVMHREFESVKPVMRKTEAGTELIWKVGDMKPREQRILSYKIKPLVEGQLKMPRAYMKYSTKDEKRYKLFSGQLTV